jgi:hypothetical protein
VENLAGGHTVIRKCELVSARDLAYAEALRFCPVIAQQYVPKRLELRVTVVGRRVFAAETATGRRSTGAGTTSR